MFGIGKRTQKIKGTVVLMPKNVLDFNAISSVSVPNSIGGVVGGAVGAVGGILGGVANVAGGVIDAATAFLGRNVSMQLISATQTHGSFNLFSFLQIIINTIKQNYHQTGVIIENN